VLPAVLNYRTKTVRFAPLIEGIASVEEIVRRVQAEAATGTTRA
jgi:hypothetical protein